MISDVDLRDWECSEEVVKLYDVPRNSIVSPVDDKAFLVDFKHVDGMYSLCVTLGKENHIVHLAAWTEVNIWKRK
jgi:hypothetical protein